MAQKKEKKGFFREFKEFISRGNVLDMAVGIIIGGAFTAIINALVNNILTPLLQWIGVSGDGMGALQVVLKEAVVQDGVVVADAVIMDFGIVISAVISFLLTALVLFLIVKAFNTVRRKAEEAKAAKEAAEKAAEEAAAAEKAAAEAAAAEKAAAEAAAAPAPEPAPTTEQLLAEIRDLLKLREADGQSSPEQKK